ncbi:hypothetical protein BP6252_05897 [Coleophoma cylindrospora]|uniref:Uncharacterized protein n=1 Tax=Coleophoma cylindrospora TaxID=1849047 RepID=A0A3D8RL36_9HELO|nr:hypothetical protein BP6252_05897 [Coleophoma cylindrospora]
MQFTTIFATLFLAVGALAGTCRDFQPCVGGACICDNIGDYSTSCKVNEILGKFTGSGCSIKDIGRGPENLCLQCNVQCCTP